jgi:prophage regulatory protein
MRMLSKRQLREMVLYSPQHIARLEAAGKFPKRVQLGQCPVGWTEQDALDRLAECIRSREQTPTNSTAKISTEKNGARASMAFKR